MSWSILGLWLLQYDKIIPSATIMTFTLARYNFERDLLSLRHLVRKAMPTLPWPLAPG